MSVEKTLENSAWAAFLESIDKSWPLAKWADVGVVVGCSGGADSVALLRALEELRRVKAPMSQGFLVAAHYNHGLRGSEGHGDAKFTENLANQLQIDFEAAIGNGDQYDESGLRDERYDFLFKVAAKTGARYITVAHSLDDDVETVLHNLMRGTGPIGISGISHTRVAGVSDQTRDFVLVRPMLSVRRQTIRNALSEINQPWREDSSNQKNKYRRNWIRNKLIPLMESEYPNAMEAMGRAVSLQKQWREFMESKANDWLEDHVINHAPLTFKRPASESDDAVITLALQMSWTQCGWPTHEMNEQHWRRLTKSCRETSDSRYSLPGDLDVHATYQAVTIRRSDRERKNLSAK